MVLDKREQAVESCTDLLNYTLGVLLTNIQDSDLQGISDIIKTKGFSSPFALIEDLKVLGFDRVDIAYTLECFNLAYGINWLRDFFEKHQEELRKCY